MASSLAGHARRARVPVNVTARLALACLPARTRARSSAMSTLRADPWTRAGRHKATIRALRKRGLLYWTEIDGDPVLLLTSTGAAVLRGLYGVES